MENSVHNSIMRCLYGQALTRQSSDHDGKMVQCAQLEPRTLFSTVPLDIDAMGLEEAIENSGVDIAVAETDGQSQIAASVTELVFIDESVPDAEFLFDELNASGTTAILIDSSEDGIEQITRHLSQVTDISSIHIISHGNMGQVQLGDALLDAEDLLGSAGQVAEWRNSLTEDADILFYGCDLASGDEGLEFMEAISELTGADVAASDDVTGHQSQGGDYDLEVTTGAIHTGIIFDDELQSLWQHTLAAPLFAGNEDAVHQANAANPDHDPSNVQVTSRGDRGSDSAVAVSRDTGNYVVVYTSESDGTNQSDVFFQLFDSTGQGITAETKVNSDTGAGNSPGNQHSASVAMDDAGNFFITWVSEDTDGSGSNIYARFFNADGTERTSAPFVVNDSPNADTLFGDQQNPDIDVNRVGTHVSITWDGAGVVDGQSDNQGVYARTFDATTATAFHDSIRLNELDANDSDQSHAVVAVDDAGVSFVAWNDIGDALGNDTIVARKFDPFGNFTLGESLNYGPITIQLINNTDPSAPLMPVNTVLNASDASIDVDRTGSIVVLSFNTSFDATGVQSGVVAQALSGADLADQLDNTLTGALATEEPGNGQTNGSIALSDDGTTAILSWQGEGNINGQSDAEGVWVRKLEVGQNIDDSNRPALFPLSGDGQDILVNQTRPGTQEFASVAVNDADNFVVAWSGSGTADNDGVFVRRFGNATLAPLVAMNDQVTTNEDTQITIAPLDNDTFTGSATISVVGGAISGQGTLTTNGDGTLTFDPGSDFQHLLPTDAPVTLVVPYTITDGTSFSSANIEISITGQNDAPVASSQFDTLSESDAPRTITPAFSDPDAADTATISGFTVNGNEACGIVSIHGESGNCGCVSSVRVRECRSDWPRRVTF